MGNLMSLPFGISREIAGSGEQYDTCIIEVGLLFFLHRESLLRVWESRMGTEAHDECNVYGYGKRVQKDVFNGKAVRIENVAADETTARQGTNAGDSQVCTHDHRGRIANAATLDVQVG